MGGIDVKQTGQSKLLKLYAVTRSENENKKWTETLNINNHIHTLKLHTRAEFNVMSVSDFERIAKHTPLYKSNCKLVTYFIHKMKPKQIQPYVLSSMYDKKSQ